MHRRTYKRHTGVKRPAKLNKRQKVQVKALISKKLETKFCDTSAVYTQTDRAGILTLLTNIPQGNAQQQRVGDRITYKSLEFRLSMFYAPSTVATDTTHNVRVLIFRWNITNSVSAPSVGVVLQTAGGVGDYRATISPINWQAQHQGDITVYHDRIYSVGSSDKAPVIQMKRKKLRGNCDFDTASPNGEGAVYLLVISDDITGVHTPSVSYQFYSRIKYVDS